jgi:hypothetical protein
MKEFLRFVDGTLISDSEGFLWSSSTIDDMMHEILCELFSQDPSSFSVQIKSEGDIEKFFHCYRTFHRSSDTRATEIKVDILDIDVVNRWRTESKKREGKKVSTIMRSHNCDFDKLLKPFIRNTQKM